MKVLCSTPKLYLVPRECQEIFLSLINNLIKVSLNCSKEKLPSNQAPKKDKQVFAVLCSTTSNFIHVHVSLAGYWLFVLVAHCVATPCSFEREVAHHLTPSSANLTLNLCHLTVKILLYKSNTMCKFCVIYELFLWPLLQGVNYEQFVISRNLINTFDRIIK